MTTSIDDSVNAGPGSGPWLSDVPTDRELYSARLFDEPLVPIGADSGDDERRALGRALRAWMKEMDPFHLEPLEKFLKEHPDSAWGASLRTNLGIVYRQIGRYGRAMEVWEAAWATTRNATTPAGQAIGDRAVSELALLNARIGRMDRLEALFDETADRPPRGSAYERLMHARQGLATMYARPGIAFLCGPMALASVRRRLLGPGPQHPSIAAVRSTTHGTSLQQVWELSQQTEVPMRRVWRPAGADLVHPAIVHWKLGHFAALTEVERDASGRMRLLMQDPTFDDDVRTIEAVIDEEASGYMLIPATMPLPEGWREVDHEEAEVVWGKGYTSGSDPGFFSDLDKKDSCGGGSGGMARFDFHGLLAALHVEDTPVWLRAPFGPSIAFKVAYNQADSFQSSLPVTAGFGPKWNFNWRQFLMLPIGETPGNQRRIQLFRGGGGVATFHFLSSGYPFSEPELQDYSRIFEVTRPDESGVQQFHYYTRAMVDGSIEHYRLSNGATPRTFYLTERVDAWGNVVRLDYDEQFRLRTITDAAGQQSRITYVANDDILHWGYYRIQRVAMYPRESSDEHVGEALFYYDDTEQHRLIRIVDMEGTESSFGYAQADRGRDCQSIAEQEGGTPRGCTGPLPDRDFMRWMRTPYGITTFQTGWLLNPHAGEPHTNPVIDAMRSVHTYSDRWVEATSPNGDTQRIEFRHDEPDMAPDGQEWMGPPMSARERLNYRQRFPSALNDVDINTGTPRSILEEFRMADEYRDERHSFDNLLRQATTSAGRVVPSWYYYMHYDRLNHPWPQDPDHNLQYRNTLYWDARAYRRAGGRPPSSPNDVLRRAMGLPPTTGPESSGTPANRRLDPRYARIVHWLHGAYNADRAVGIAESTVNPGENRVWYYYKSQKLAGTLDVPFALLARVARHIPDPNPTYSMPRPERLNDISVSYEYNEQGKITRVTDPAGRQTRIEYHENRFDVARVLQGVARTAPGGQPTQWQTVARFEEYIHGLPRVIVNAAGQTTRILYNQRGQPLVIRRPDGSTIRFTYDPIPGANVVRLDDEIAVFESEGNLRAIASPEGIVRLTYDERNRVKESVDRAGVSRSYRYDGLDRIIEVTYHDGTKETVSYQLRSSGTGEGLSSKGIEWTRIVDRDGYSVVRAFDPQRRLVMVRNGAGDTVRFEYPDLTSTAGGSENLLTLSDANNHRTIWRQSEELSRFDDRPTEMERADGTVVRYWYDSLGRPSRITTAGGYREDLTYTIDGMLDTRLGYDGSGRWYEYDPDYPRLSRAGRVLEETWRRVDDIQFEYVPAGSAGAGRVQRAIHSPSRVIVAYQYDQLGRLTGRTTGTASLQMGRLVPGVIDTSFQVRYAANGLPGVVSSALGSTRYLYQSDETGSGDSPGSSRLRGVILPNRTVATVSYEERGDRRMRRFRIDRAGASGELIYDLGLGYTRAGRRSHDVSRWNIEGLIGLPWRREYTYDRSARLERVGYLVDARGGSLLQGTDQYRYDSNGNLRSEINDKLQRDGLLEVIRQSVSEYDNGDRLRSRTVTDRASRVVVAMAASTVTGWLQEDGQAVYGWDPLGQLNAVRVLRTDSATRLLTRDVFGRVIHISDAHGSRSLIWDGLTLLEEREGADRRIVRSYMPEGFRQGEANYYYLRDALGSVIGLMDQLGNVVKLWSYDAWGFRKVMWQAYGAEDLRPAIGYARYLQHEDSGLCLTPNRAYSPALRRWLSRDPIGYAGGDINLYAYTGGDPLNAADPTGLAVPAIVWILGVAAITGFVYSGILNDDAEGHRLAYGMRGAVGGVVGAGVTYLAAPVSWLGWLATGTLAGGLNSFAGELVERVAPRSCGFDRRINWKAVGLNAAVGFIAGATGKMAQEMLDLDTVLTNVTANSITDLGASAFAGFVGFFGDV